MCQRGTPKTAMSTLIFTQTSLEKGRARGKKDTPRLVHQRLWAASARRAWHLSGPGTARSVSARRSHRRADIGGPSREREREREGSRRGRKRRRRRRMKEKKREREKEKEKQKKNYIYISNPPKTYPTFNGELSAQRTRLLQLLLAVPLLQQLLLRLGEARPVADPIWPWVKSPVSPQ